MAKLYEFIPPIIIRFKNNIFKKKITPDWYTITNGNLKGRKIFISNLEPWQKSMIDGSFDKIIFDTIQTFKLENKIIYEIGAHIGYHCLNYATEIKNAKIYAFEPNSFNLQRLKINLKENKDLADNILINPYALSDKNETTEFFFSDNIDNGNSSMSFINNADTPLVRDFYKQNKFKKELVTCKTIDTIIKEGFEVPNIIKIDVEGAEYLVLQGAKNLLSTYSPKLFVEVHSNKLLIKVYEFLKELNYKIDIIEEKPLNITLIYAEK